MRQLIATAQVIAQYGVVAVQYANDPLDAHAALRGALN
jgi:hypothetical protein